MALDAYTVFGRRVAPATPASSPAYAQVLHDSHSGEPARHETERARKTVRARIADVLRRLYTHHPELAAHLRATASTGVTCRYEPHDALTRWAL